MKKLLLFVLMLMLAAACALAESKESGDYTYELLEDGTAIITEYTGSEAEVTVPTKWDGHAVSAISDWAYGDRPELTKVIIPDSVTGIGSNPFYYCPNLTGIEVSLEHPTLAVIDGALYYKPEKSLICYPAGIYEMEYTIPQGIASIDSSAFNGARYLTTVNVPGSVKDIGNSAFEGCDDLTTINLAEGVESLGYCAFDDCNSLRTITLPDSITTLNDNPFARCDALETIVVSLEHPALAVIDGVLFSTADKRLVVYPCMKQSEAYEVPQGITEIASHAFYNSPLKSIVIPDSVTKIETGAFECCGSLQSITIPSSVTTFGDYLFNQCSEVTVTLTRSSALVPYLKEENISYTYSDLYDWLNN